MFWPIDFKNRLKVFLREHWCDAIVIVIVAVCLGLTYRRLFFGVDFTDEAFYATAPLRFLNGGKPFVDEVNIVMQFPSFFIAPFLHIYTVLSGGTDGMILFLRQLYFAATCLTGASIFLILKNKIAWQASLLTALIPIVLIPYGIPSLSYNTIGSLFFLLGCFLAFWCISSEKKYIWMMLPGIVHGFAALAYPTLPITILCVAFILLFFKKRFLFFYIVGVFIVAFFLLIFLINVGFSALKTSYDYANTVGNQLGGIKKIARIFSEFYGGFAYKLWAVLLVGTIVAGIARKIKFIPFLLLIFPLMIFVLSVGGNYSICSAMGYVSYYGLMVLPLFIFLRKQLLARQLFYLIGLPSLVAGAVTAYSSDNGFFGSFLGFLPAFVITSLFVFLLWNLIKSIKNKKIILYLGLVPLICVISVLLFFQNALVYRDDALSELTKEVTIGPYRGMFTTSEKNLYMESFIYDARLAAGNNEKIMIYDGFPAGYLFTGAIPATNTAWLRSSFSAPRIDRASTIVYFKQQNVIPDIVIRMKRVYISINETSDAAPFADDLLDKFITDNGYIKIRDAESYDIYER